MGTKKTEKKKPDARSAKTTPEKKPKAAKAAPVKAEPPVVEAAPEEKPPAAYELPKSATGTIVVSTKRLAAALARCKLQGAAIVDIHNPGNDLLVVRGTLPESVYEETIPCKTERGHLSGSYSLRDLRQAITKCKAFDDVRIALGAYDAGLRTAVISGDRPGSEPIDVSGHAPVNSLPTLDAHNALAIPVEQFRAAMTYALSASSEDETRFHIAGAAIMPDGRIVATDGHRLHMVRGIPECKALGEPRLLPGKLMKNLIAAMLPDSTPEIRYRKTAVWLTGLALRGGAIVELRVSTERGVFPPVDQVVPKYDADCTIDVSPRELYDAVKKTGTLVSSTGTNSVVIGAGRKGGFVVFINDKRAEEKHSEVLRFKAFTAGPPRVLSLQPGYLLDALQPLLDQPRVTLEINDGLDPVVVRHGNYTAVVMPAAHPMVTGIDRAATEVGRRSCVMRAVGALGMNSKALFGAGSEPQPTWATPATEAPIAPPPQALAPPPATPLAPDDPLRTPLETTATLLVSGLYGEHGQAIGRQLLAFAAGERHSPTPKPRSPKAPKPPANPDRSAAANKAWATRMAKWKASGDPRANGKAPRAAAPAAAVA